MSGTAALLDVVDLKTWYPIRRGVFGRTVGNVKAVNGVSFHMDRGETLGVVGESGCGKSTLLRTMVHLERPESGRVAFAGHDVFGLSKTETRAFRRRVQVVFQDPQSSLDPRMSVGQILGEPMTIHRIGARKDRHARACALLELVGLPSGHMTRFPHELSGGERQRIGIARALALEPDLILLDEPVSALDVSIQAQILTLLGDLQRELRLTYLFVAHDLSVVRQVSGRVLVMYLGKVMEIGPVDTVTRSPAHPYTQALISAAPVPDPDTERLRSRRRIVLEGDLPSPADPPSGCVFCTRCPRAAPVCAIEEPEPAAIGSGHVAACHFPSIDGATPP